MTLARKLRKEIQEAYEEQLEGFYDPDLTERENGHVIRRARDMYLKDFPYERIFLSTGLPYDKFYRLQKRWKKLKEHLDAKIIEAIRKDAIADKAEEFVNKGLQIGLAFLNKVIKRDVELEPKDFKLIMDSVMAIHRVKQVETGEPTDIVQYAAMTPVELREYLMTVAKQVGEKHGELLGYYQTGTDVPVEGVLESFLPEKTQET